MGVRGSLLDSFPPTKECLGCECKLVTDSDVCGACGDTLAGTTDPENKLAVWGTNLQQFIHQQMNSGSVTMDDQLFQQVYELAAYLQAESARQQTRIDTPPLRFIQGGRKA
jgi:hypothetical protein